MIAGIVAGGLIWCIFTINFLIFPELSSLTAALVVGPCAGGYFAARLGGSRAASVLTIVASIITLVLSITHIRHTSWQYAHQLWGGVILLIILMVLGNFLFLCFGSLIGIQIRRQGRLQEEPLEKEAVKPDEDHTIIAEAPDMPNYSQTRLAALTIEERDLLNDLTVIKEKKGLQWVSPELAGEKQSALEKQLLDVILEKERLMRKYKKPLMETIEALATQEKYSV